MGNYLFQYEPGDTPGIVSSAEIHRFLVRDARKDSAYVESNGQQEADRQKALQAKMNSAESCAQLELSMTVFSCLRITGCATRRTAIPRRQTNFSFFFTDLEFGDVLHFERSGMSDNKFAYVCAQKIMYS